MLINKVQYICIVKNINNVYMEKKKLQEMRIKSYFLDAARDILKSEGLKGISVRNVAEKAGYSYATMYNYFRDINELIFLCVIGFQKDCSDYIETEIREVSTGIPSIKAISLAFMKFFVQYPGIFELLYIERMADLGHHKKLGSEICGFYNVICEKHWKMVAENYPAEQNKIEIARQQLNYIITGLLLCYLNRYQPQSYSEFLRQSTNLIDQIIQQNRFR